MHAPLCHEDKCQRTFVLDVVATVHVWHADVDNLHQHSETLLLQRRYQVAPVSGAGAPPPAWAPAVQCSRHQCPHRL